MVNTVLDPQASPDLSQLLRTDLPVPLYHQIFNILRDQVIGGELPYNSQLPTEFSLAESFGVSRITAKRALDELATAGLVERQRGRGTHVIHRLSPKPVRGPLIGLLENLEILAEATDVSVLQFRRTTPPPAIRELFELEPGESMVHAIRVRSRTGTPFGYYTSWTRTDDPEFNADNLATHSRLALFKRSGIVLAQVEQSLSAVAADSVVALHLKVEAGAPLLTLERQSFDGDGQLVDLLNIQYRPDQFRYQMSMDLEATPHG